MRLLPPLNRRLLGLVAWFAVLGPAFALLAARDGAAHLLLRGGDSVVTLASDAPSLTLVSWILLGTLAVTIPVMWTRTITARRRRRSPAPSGAQLGRAVTVRDGTAATGALANETSDAAFRLAARAWRERLAITAPSPAAGRDARFNAVLRIHSARGDRAQAPLERLLRECTRRWERRACEPGENGITVLRYGVRVPRASRGRLLDALRHSSLVEGVELR